MEDRGAQDGIGMTIADSCDEMVQGSHAAAGDDRNRHGIGDPPGEHEIVARLRSIAVH